MASVQNSTTPHNNIPMGNKIIETIIMCIIIVVCIIGNIALWIVVLRVRALRSVTSMFILGLSAADVLVATVNMPLTVYTVIVGYWPFSSNACIAIGFLNMITLVCSVLSLCNISINRYFMVCRATKFQSIYNTRNAVFMMIAVVTISTMISVPPLIGWAEYVYTPTHSFCFADWAHHMSYTFFMIGCCFGIPFAVMTVCNILIIRSVRESKRKVMTSVRSTRVSTMMDISRLEDTGDEFGTNIIKISRFNEQSKHKVLNINDKAFSIERNRKDHEQDERYIPGLPVIKVEQDISDNITNSTSIQRMPITRNNCLSLTNHHSSSFSTESSTYLFIQKEVASLSIQAHPKPTLTNSSCLEQEQKIQADKYAIHSDSEDKHSPSQTKSSFSNSSVKLRHENSVSKERYRNSNNLCTPKLGIPRRQTRKLRRSEEIRLAFSLVIVVVLFVICWLPYCISMVTSIFYKGHVPREFNMFTLIIGYANSGCNPIVYGIMNQRFKIGFKRLFCFWKSENMSIKLSG